MIEVQLPDGTVVEFPDGTDDAAMTRALKQIDVGNEAKSRIEKMGSSALGKARLIGYGAERALDEAAMGLKQLAIGLSPDEQRELAIRREMEKVNPAGSWQSRVPAEIAMLGAPAAAAARALPRTLASKVLPNIGVGAAVGGGVGAAQPVIGDESRSDNVKAGAVMGAAGEVGGRVLGRAISGLIPKSVAGGALPQNVQDAATLGQLADKNTTAGKIASSIEERLTSVPVTGDILKRSRQGGVDAWRQDVIDRSMPKGFKPTRGADTRDQIAEGYGEFKKRYGQALSGVDVAPSQLFEKQLRTVLRDPKTGIPQDQAERILDQTIENYASRFGQNGKMSGSVAKDFESFLSDQARQYSKSEVPGHSNIGKVYRDLERAWSTSYRRQMGSGPRKQINELDSQYGNYKTAERAAGAVGNVGGDFTPAQLTTAVSGRTGKARFGRGEGFLADEARLGKEVFTDSLPSSGTTERAMLMGVPAAAVIDPITVATGGVAAATANKILTNKTTKNALMGDTKIQRFLKMMRAQDAARQFGMPGGVMSQQFIEDSTEY
jgi:hypothetical protein